MKRRMIGLVVCLWVMGVGANTNAEIKNILFIMADDLKASTLAVYGNTMNVTPNLDRLASKSMVFDRAYCQGVVCAPSRPSMMFSRYRDADFKKHVSFTEFLKGKGFYTARVSKIYHMAIPGDIMRGEHGKDHEASWTERFSFQAKEESSPGAYAALNKNIFTREMEGRAGAGTADRYYVTVKTDDATGSDQPDYMAAEKAIELLRSKKDEPFVLAVGFVRPHYPMVAPAQYFEGYDYRDVVMPKRVKGDWDDMPKYAIAKFTSEQSGLDKYPDNQKRMWADYYGAVSFMDAQLGKVIDELDRLGLRETTAIVFTSDHGYHLGEHDFWQKANLHEEVTRVPLMIDAPGYGAGRSNSLVELADLYPTVLGLVGYEAPEQCHGVSLVDVLDNPSVRVRDFAFSYHGANSAVRGDRWAYIRYEQGGEELYDMDNDPGQFTNLAEVKEYEEALKMCRAAMDEKLKMK